MRSGEKLIETGHYIAALAKSTEQARVSIGLLDVIENTISSLTAFKNILDGFGSIINETMIYIEGKQIVESDYIDPDDVAIESLKKTSLSLQSELDDLIQRKFTILKDSRLNNNHCESLQDAYDLAITALSSLIEDNENIRLAIIKHDLASEPRGVKKFDSVELLLFNLHQ